jgi:hypothetical protein
MSLYAPWLILQVLKLTIMKVSSSPEKTRTRNHLKTNLKPDLNNPTPSGLPLFASYGNKQNSWTWVQSHCDTSVQVCISLEEL